MITALHRKRQTDVRTFTYDALDRITQVDSNLPWGPLQTYAYDAVGNLLYSNEQGPNEFSYNLAGQITTMLSYNGAVAMHTYDDNGNLISVVGHNLQGSGPIYMDYDKENRLIRELRNNVATTYTYSGDGLKRSEIHVDESGDPPAISATTFVWDGSEYLGEQEEMV